MNIFTTQGKATFERLVFIQKLTWDEIAYILCCKNRQWKLIDTISTDVNTLEISLFAGEYRYKIFVYNILNINGRIEIVQVKHGNFQINEYNMKAG